MKYILPCLLILFLFEGCNSQPGAKKEASKIVKDSISITKTDSLGALLYAQHDSVVNDYAMFLAGIKPNGSAIPAKLTGNNFFKKYTAEMDSNFKKIEKNRLTLMRDWGKTELSNEQAHPTTLFYPFSGPDILHALAFYPNATQYVMIAMERPGDIPNINKMDSATSAFYLNSVYQSLQDIFEKSYFITRKMIQDLQKVKVNGVAPLLCVFLERSGQTIVSLHKKHLNNDGSISNLSPDSLANQLNDFIEITFRSPGVDTVRKLVYFRANLGNQTFEGLPPLSQNTALLNYLNKLPDFYMYTKSASYLMNYGTFSTIRDLCLKKSKSILQDDTGIGYQYFDQKVWKLNFYGKYVTPVRDFKGVYDKGLADAYKADSANVKSLKFSLGYHWGNINNQNLMRAERK